MGIPVSISFSDKFYEKLTKIIEDKLLDEIDDDGEAFGDLFQDEVGKIASDLMRSVFSADMRKAVAEKVKAKFTPQVISDHVVKRAISKIGF